MYVSISGPLTAMSESHHGRLHTLETQMGAEEEVTNATRSLPRWRSLPTWKRRKRRKRWKKRGATTQTTLPRLHSRSSTCLSSNGTTTLTNTRVPNPSPSRILNPAPLYHPHPLARRSAISNQAKNPVVTTIVLRRRGTGTRSGGGNNRVRQLIKAEWEEEGRDLKGRSTAQTENSRVWRTSPPSTARSPPCMTARRKRRNEEETTVSAGLRSPVVEGPSPSNQSKVSEYFPAFLLFSDATDIKLKMSILNSHNHLCKLIVMKEIIS